MPTALDRDHLYDHILGSLVASALGDAMGAATEQHTTAEIVQQFGGLLRELRTPSSETLSFGNQAGQITDDSSQMFALAEALIATDGNLTEADWIKALLHWASTSREAFAMGPTTRPLLEALAAGRDTSAIGKAPNSTRKLASFGTTNGAAMRIGPAGLVCPGDVERAVHLAWTTARPTHDTQIAAAGAGAIAAGVAHALLPEADVFSVTRACLQGARLGEALGAKEGRRVPGPSIVRRIELAVDAALRADNLQQAVESIEATVGNSVMMVESLPAAIGVFVAAGGDPVEAAVGGANIGNDSDTIAAMACSLAGALRGIAAIPIPLYDTLRAANEQDIPALARGLTAIAWERWHTRHERANH